jgi:hypothetical protein
VIAAGMLSVLIFPLLATRFAGAGGHDANESA